MLTWDPRGFGASGGTVESDSADFEGRDTQRLIDWVARQPGVQLDKAGDPRMGMAGASYGGGIQLITAAIDCRVDAIVPQIAWHSLATSLAKAATPKTGWGNLLFAGAAAHQLDPHITSAHAASNETGVISQEDTQWFTDRGPGDLVAKITAPTLLEQGTVDTLFTLDEAATNFKILHDNGVPTAMLWICSGHGVCLTNPGDRTLGGKAAIAWFDRYVKNDTSTKVSPTFEYADQNGTEFTADEFPLPAGDPIVATGGGDLTLTADGGAGPAQGQGTAGLGKLVLPITPARASNALNVPISAGRAAHIVGAPKLTIKYSGTVAAGVRPTRVFAQLVDEATGLVLGNQITPIDGDPRRRVTHRNRSARDGGVHDEGHVAAHAPTRRDHDGLRATSARRDDHLRLGEDRVADRDRRHGQIAALSRRSCGSRRTARRAPGARW